MKKINNKSKRMLEIEGEFNNSIEEILWCLHVEQGKHNQQISKELGIRPNNVTKWLRLAGIYSQHLSSLCKERERNNY